MFYNFKIKYIIDQTIIPFHIYGMMFFFVSRM